MTRPLIKTRKFSTLHIEIFEQILASQKTNRDLNTQFGYTVRSHALVDHSRKVMYKLLALENLSISEYREQVRFPRKYRFWWGNLFFKYKNTLVSKAINAEYYNKRKINHGGLCMLDEPYVNALIAEMSIK